MRQEMKRREPFPDIVRGFAIILVCLGHCIQMGSGEEYFTAAFYYDSRLYQWIYSFHMPLFMLVSGYFAGRSLQRAEEQHRVGGYLRHRTFALLFPVLFWTLFETLVSFIRTVLTIPEGDPAFLVKIQQLAVYFARQIPQNFAGELWFLWAVWWCSLAVAAVRKLFRDSRWVYALLAAAGLFTPDGLNFGVYKYVFPYFLLGYLTFRERWLTGRLHSAVSDRGWKRWGRIAAVGLVFLLLFLGFRRSFLIYQSGFRIVFSDGLMGIVRAVVKDAYRFLIGAAGCTFFLLLLWELYRSSCHGVPVLEGGREEPADSCTGQPGEGIRTGRTAAKAEGMKGMRLPWNILSCFGRHSMGIYILSTYWIVWLIKPLADPLAPSLGRNLLETALVVCLSLGTSLLLERIPGLRRTVGG